MDAFFFYHFYELFFEISHCFIVGLHQLNYFVLGKIRVTDIKVYAYHGCLEEEAKIGSDYLVQVTVDADLTTSTQSDDLIDTVDYVHINAIVTEEMGIRSKLLEHVAQRILNRIFREIPLVDSADVSVSKMNPPIGGDVKMVTIELHQKRS